MAAVTIRDGTLDDLAHIEALHDSFYVQSGKYEPVFNDYVSGGIDAFRRTFQPGRDRLWMAHQRDAIVGFVGCLARADGWAQLRWLYVDQSARGAGLGGTLTDAVVEHARSSGMAGVMLWTMSDQDAARRLYEARGFTLTEEIPAPWHQSEIQQRFDLPFDAA